MRIQVAFTSSRLVAINIYVGSLECVHFAYVIRLSGLLSISFIFFYFRLHLFCINNLVVLCRQRVAKAICFDGDIWLVRTTDAQIRSFNAVISAVTF